MMLYDIISFCMMVYGVLVVIKGYHQNLKPLDIEKKQASPRVKYPKCPKDVHGSHNNTPNR